MEPMTKGTFYVWLEGAKVEGMAESQEAEAERKAAVLMIDRLQRFLAGDDDAVVFETEWDEDIPS
jgi:hypothetical protein